MRLPIVLVGVSVVLGGARLRAEELPQVPRLPLAEKPRELGKSGGQLADWRMARVLTFDGKADQVRVADSPALRVQTFTLSAWVKPRECSSQQPILAKAESAGNWCSYLLRIEGDGRVLLAVANKGAERDAHWTTQGNLPPGRWHHVAATWSNLQGDVSDAAIYIDGAPAKLDMTRNTKYDRSFCIGYSAEPLYIGRDQFPTGHFGGSMARVEVIDRVFTAGEIKVIVARGIEE